MTAKPVNINFPDFTFNGETQFDGLLFSNSAGTVVHRITAPVNAAGNRVTLILGDATDGEVQTAVFVSILPVSDRDTDGDGMDDIDEVGAGTDPRVPDVRFVLQPGLHLVSWPIESTETAFNLLAVWGDALNKISHINVEGKIESAWMDGVNPRGVNFSIQPLKGYYIELSQDSDFLVTGTPISDTVDLKRGINFVGFPGVPSEFDAYKLLEQLGETAASSVRRYDPVSGRYQTAAWFNGQVVGNNFTIERGSAYFISMRQAVSGVTLP